MPAVRAVRLSTLQRRRLAGRYATGPGQSTVLEFLTPSVAAIGGSQHLVATSDTSFASPEAYDALVVVERDAAGAVTALRWTDASDSERYPRVRARVRVTGR